MGTPREEPDYTEEEVLERAVSEAEHRFHQDTPRSKHFAPTYRGASGSSPIVAPAASADAGPLILPVREDSGDVEAAAQLEALASSSVAAARHVSLSSLSIPEALDPDEPEPHDMSAVNAAAAPPPPAIALTGTLAAEAAPRPAVIPTNGNLRGLQPGSTLSISRQPSRLESATEKSRQARLKGFEGDACGECGQFTMVRNGTCLKCVSCGATSGCS